jgi:hypothetical protein
MKCGEWFVQHSGEAEFYLGTIRRGWPHITWKAEVRKSHSRLLYPTVTLTQEGSTKKIKCCNHTQSQSFLCA